MTTENHTPDDREARLIVLTHEMASASLEPLTANSVEVLNRLANEVIFITSETGE